MQSVVEGDIRRHPRYDLQPCFPHHVGCRHTLRKQHQNNNSPTLLRILDRLAHVPVVLCLTRPVVTSPPTPLPAAASARVAGAFPIAPATAASTPLRPPAPAAPVVSVTVASRSGVHQTFIAFYEVRRLLWWTHRSCSWRITTEVSRRVVCIVGQQGLFGTWSVGIHMPR